MAFHHDTICHFSCKNQLNPPHWESLPPPWPGLWHKRNVGCHANGRGGGDIQAYNRLLKLGPFVKAWFCSVLHCKLLWWERNEWYLKKAKLCFFVLLCISCWTVSLNTGFYFIVTWKCTCNYLWHSVTLKDLWLFRFTCFTNVCVASENTSEGRNICISINDASLMCGCKYACARAYKWYW